MFQKLNLKDLYFGNIAKVTKNQEIILVKENIIFIRIKDVYGNIYYQTFPGQKDTKKYTTFLETINIETKTGLDHIHRSNTLLSKKV